MCWRTRVCVDACACAGTGAGTWPPATAQDLQRYTAAFAQLDTDRDGMVQGGDCFGFFMQVCGCGCGVRLC